MGIFGSTTRSGRKRTPDRLMLIVKRRANRGPTRCDSAPGAETRSARNAAGRTLLLKRLRPGDVIGQDEREGVQLRIETSPQVPAQIAVEPDRARGSPQLFDVGASCAARTNRRTRRPPYVENPAIRGPLLWLPFALTKLIHINMLSKILRRRHGRLASPSRSDLEHDWLEKLVKNDVS